MEYREAVAQLSPDVVQRLRNAVETGRWPDGRALSVEQRREALQAVIAWEALHLPDSERTGYIDRRGKDCDSSGAAVEPLRWRDSGRGEGA
jgi:uncharacterized protein YeaC (DUF1315 family)